MLRTNFRSITAIVYTMPVPRRINAVDNTNVNTSVTCDTICPACLSLSLIDSGQFILSRQPPSCMHWTSNRPWRVDDMWALLFADSYTQGSHQSGDKKYDTTRFMSVGLLSPEFSWFLPARRCASAVFAVERCLSVCLSHAGIVSKRLNLS